jgi:hypothetical protein
MDVNYSRWMSKDPDAEPEVIEDEPRRFSFPWPSGSAVAATAMVSLIVLCSAAFVRSTATPEVTTDQAQTVETPTTEQDSGPGAASVDDSALVDSTSDDSTSDSAASDDSTTSDWSAPAGLPPGPRRMERREFGPHNGVPPSPSLRVRRAFRP